MDDGSGKVDPLSPDSVGLAAEDLDAHLLALDQDVVLERREGFVVVGFVRPVKVGGDRRKDLEDDGRVVVGLLSSIQIIWGAGDRAIGAIARTPATDQKLLVLAYEAAGLFVS